MSDTNAGKHDNLNSVRSARSEEPSRSRFRRLLIITSAWTAGFAILALAAALWLQSKASTINAELVEAMKLAPQLRDDILHYDAAAAADTVALLKDHTGQARAASNDPLWTMASMVPWIGGNFQAASEISTAADDVATLAAAPLASALQSLDWKALTPSADGVDLQPLTAAKPKLVAAAHAVSQSSDRLNRIDDRNLLPQIADPLLKARNQLESLRDGLDAAADVASLAPEMMGSQTPKRYLLLIQNNAEVRASGGIPGALAVLTLDKGRLTLGSQTSATSMGSFTPPMEVDPQQELIYSGRLGKFMQDVNLTPDFPTAAATARAMWKKETGESLDGVVSIDPVALAYILDSTGPIELKDPELRALTSDGALPVKLTGKNVVKTLLSDVYSAVPEPTLQDAYFAGVAREVFASISGGGTDAKQLINALSRGANEGRVLLWSSSHEEQAMISEYSLGGAAVGGRVSPSEFGVYFNDGTGAKMDYYIKRTVQLVEGCPHGGYGQIRVRVTSTNTAPNDAATSLPEYVTGGGAFGVPAGTVQTNIVTYGPVQSNVESVMADGKKISFASQSHSGRPVGTITVALPPGKSSTVEFLFDKIVQHTEPKLSVTPTVQPLKDVVLGTTSETCTPAA